MKKKTKEFSIENFTLSRYFPRFNPIFINSDQQKIEEIYSEKKKVEQKEITQGSNRKLLKSDQFQNTREIFCFRVGEFKNLLCHCGFKRFVGYLKAKCT